MRLFYKLRWQLRRHWKTLSGLMVHRSFFLGLPAFIIALGMIAIIVLANRRVESGQLAARYETRWRAANADGDRASAELYLRKLVSLRPDTPDYHFLLAESAAKSGDTSRAQRILTRLAPEDDYGYGPAHLAIAMTLAQKRSPTFGELARIEHHARMKLRQDNDDPHAHGLLGLVYIRYENDEKAIEHLTIAAGVHSRYGIPLARKYVEAGKYDKAFNMASKARKAFRQQLNESPDDHGVRIQYAKSLLFLEDFDAVEKTLAEFRDVDTNESQKALVVNLYLGLWDVLEKRNNKDVARRIRIMHEVIKLDEDNAGMLNRLARLLAVSGSNLQEFRSQVRRSLTNGRGLASVHLVLGMAALRARNIPQARFHLDAANSLEPNSQKTLAALALSYAREKPARADEALRTLNLIHENAFEGNALLLGIRGEVYAAAGEEKRALPDLEKALSLQPNAFDIRETLSNVYAKLGQTDIAEFHREIVVARKPQIPKFVPVVSDAEARMIARANNLDSEKPASANSVLENPVEQKPAPKLTSPKGNEDRTYIASKPAGSVPKPPGSTAPKLSTTQTQEIPAESVAASTASTNVVVTQAVSLPTIIPQSTFQRSLRAGRQK